MNWNSWTVWYITISVLVLILILHSSCYAKRAKNSKNKKSNRKVLHKDDGPQTCPAPGKDSCGFKFLSHDIPMYNCWGGRIKMNYTVNLISSKKATWHGANKKCGSKGYRLKTFKQVEDIEEILEAIGKIDCSEEEEALWVGYSAFEQYLDPNISMDDWLGADGKGLSRKLKPNLMGNVESQRRRIIKTDNGLYFGSCLELVVKSSKLRSADCFNRHKFLCEHMYITPSLMPFE